MALTSNAFCSFPEQRGRSRHGSVQRPTRPRLSNPVADKKTRHAALSKWYLCGSEGNFEKNESLAVTFAEKAAARQLPAAEFALGYFYEVGIGGPIDLEKAKRWYERVSLPFGPL